MNVGSVRRLIAAGALLACVAVLPGQAIAVHLPPDVAINDVSVGEGGTLTFTVARNGDVTEETTVTATTADGTANAPGDYAAKETTVTIPVGESTATFDVVTAQDGLAEGNENLTVNLSAPTNGNIADAQGVGTITDDDTLPTVSIAGVTDPTVSTVTEGQQATFNVSLSASYPETVTVNWSTAPGTASGSDFTGTGGTVTFNPGETGPKQVGVTTTQDLIDEENETFTVNLSAPSKATIGTGSATGTINDNDNPPSITIGDVAVTEGNSGTLNANFPVTLSGASGKTVTVGFATAAGTAGADDFVATSGTLTIPIGDTGGTIAVPVKGDTISEPEEQFFVNIFGPSNATLGADTQGKATITDNDVAPVINSISDPTVAEGDADGTVSFVVTLSSASGVPVTVKYSTADGTAKAGDDYVAVQNATLTFPANTTSAQINVTVKGDTFSEAEENFFVNLFSPTNATLGGDTQGRATITDNDPVPVPTVGNVSITEGNTGTGGLQFTVSLPGRSTEVTFNYRTVEGSATASGAQPDYQVAGGAITFPAAAGVTTKTVTVTVRGDVLDEVDETFRLEIVRPADGGVAASATGTILNDDNNAKLSISDSTADEPSTGTATLTFTVTLAPASGRPVSVNWATADGTATAGADYTPGSGALIFAPGETSKEIQVSVIGDTINEENETVLVNLSANSGAGFATAGSQGAGTIVDKNAPPSLSISDTVASEGGSGATFTVTLAGTTLRTVTVRFNTNDGTAIAGSDYVARVGTLTFAPGEKSKAITVTVIDDAVAESAEDFFVGLGDAVNATITKSLGAASIEASDQVLTTPKPTNPPATAPKPPTGKVVGIVYPKMILGPRTVQVKGNVARMLVTCQKASPISCLGSVLLQNSVKPAFKLGTKKFNVKKGKRSYQSIRLTVRALAILRKDGILRAKVIVLVKTGKKTIRVSPGIVTLTKPKVTVKPKVTTKTPPTDVVVDP